MLPCSTPCSLVLGLAAEGGNQPQALPLPLCSSSACFPLHPRTHTATPMWAPPLLGAAPCPSRDAARRALLDLLDGVRGRKGLVLEAEFASPLSLVAEALTLKEHGVEV